MFPNLHPWSCLAVVATSVKCLGQTVQQAAEPWVCDCIFPVTGLCMNYDSVWFYRVAKMFACCVICGSKVERLVACPVKIHKPYIGNYNFSSPNGWSATHWRRKWQIEGFSSSVFHCLPSGAFPWSLKMPQIHEKRAGPESKPPSAARNGVPSPERWASLSPPLSSC